MGAGPTIAHNCIELRDVVGPWQPSTLFMDKCHLVLIGLRHVTKRGNYFALILDIVYSR